MPRILVTGGCGYIGSHTLIDLLENGYEAVSIDNLLRSNASLLSGVERITGRRIQNNQIDLCDAAALHSFFENDHKFD
ncbi:MAG TPA: NAD-dependent epimerase/dehydratase family protein, partial [Chitinophagales bacterium]|nr:NAD-dependent epimerase/dehydratase family protein [Chitinophagales bacterium]